MTAGINPAVSVVIAAYNMAQYVDEAVTSVLAQTFEDLEVVVIDDGSKDNIADVMRAFDSDSRVRFISQENRGQPRAKNAGIRAAKGEFIAFCDADDVWDPRKLERQMPAFESPKVGVVYSATAEIDVDGNKTGVTNDGGPSGSILSPLFIRNFVPFGTTVVRRSVLDAVGLFDESLPMGIDWDLWLRVATRWEFAFIDEPLYLYRVWPGQMSKNWKGRYEYSFKIMEKFLATHPGALPPRVIRQAYADTYVQRGICYALFDRNRVQARSDFWQAVQVDRFFLPAWRELGKLLFKRPRLR